MPSSRPSDIAPSAAAPPAARQDARPVRARLVGERLDHLDGLRGLAALIVVLFHLLSALVPGMVPEQHPGAHWIAYTPVAIAWNGSFAVLVFFVLSGFVVTAATLRKRNPLWIDVAIRYLRLAVPATISVVIAWALLMQMPDAATALEQRTGSPWLGYILQGDIPGFGSALLDGTVLIFARGGSQFNNVLWTMKPELLGSLMCFAICLCPGRVLRMVATAAFAVAAIVVHRYEYEAFVVGIVLHELWSMDRLPARWPMPALVAGAAIGAFSGDAAARFGFGGLPDAFQFRHHGGLLYPVAAGLVVYGTMQSPRARRVFSHRWAIFLGTISFPLYLIHVPLIDTVLAGLLVRLPDNAPLSVAVGLVAAAMMIPLAYGFERLIERPFLRLLGRLRRRLRHIDARVRDMVVRVRTRRRRA